ncbi:MAG: ADP-ribosylglycohydrolase family protein [Planctomycetota bacterium]|jgi:hypothetical protein
MGKNSVTILMVVAAILDLIVGAPADGAVTVTPFRRIAVKDYVDKWRPNLVNQFEQDDIYVEMTFLRSLELYGFDVSIRQAGIDFANSGYDLWHANRFGRENLRNGIAPPDSGHPKFNSHADDIDYQIEADYAGLIAPGLPNVAIELGEKFGRLMNYGDGLYGGQFVAGMYAEAFFETDVEKIIRAGLRCIPKGSQYHECISDVLKWYKQNPDNWKKTWQLIEDKYQDNSDYRLFTCETDEDFNIDAKINGAYIVVGLLYGKGDLDKTMIISTRCGQDSDCNPSNAGGVLFTTIGFSKLPEKFKSALNPEGKFSHTPYNFPMLTKVCEKLVRQAVKRAGGRIEKDTNGEEVFVIPAKKPRPSKLEQCWEPGPIANSRFTVDELHQLHPPAIPKESGVLVDISEDVEKFVPGWSISNCGIDMNPGLYDELRGKKKVLLTHPLDENTGCVLSKKVKIPEGKETTLRLVVGHHPQGDWTIIVKANDKELLNTLVGEETAEDRWLDISVDLTAYAGKSVNLQLVNQPNGWAWEAAYWDQIKLVSK